MAEHDVAALSQLPEGRGWPVTAGGRPIALFRVGDRIHAFENVCRHLEFPVDGGAVRKGIITCPWHGWTYRVESGALVTVFGDRPGLRAYRVRVEDGRVKVIIEDEMGESTP